MSEAKEPISLHKFYVDAGKRSTTIGERLGQAMFNHLNEVRPELAAQIVGSDKDPFYAVDRQHPNWYRFILFLADHWYNPAE